ncbi:TetR family transcriptional regulator [Aquibaculum sediminis]|uniref:TetR family transcriptional regulator n=1 Tax=Aquibaculum sediminis TaxID=3231907 RepID=UPI0034546CD8
MAARRPQKSNRDRIIDATLQLAAERPWSEVRLPDIAAASELPLRQIYEEFGSRSEILAAFSRRIDAEVLGEDDMSAEIAEESPRDQLFEVLMRRFEAMQPHRAALSSILACYSCQPTDSLSALPQLGRSMAWMLTAAGISPEGWRGILRIKGVSAIWLATLRVWLKDDSEDMAKTMAALDRNLRRAEDLISRLPRRRRRGSAEDAGAGAEASADPGPEAPSGAPA